MGLNKTVVDETENLEEEENGQEQPEEQSKQQEQDFVQVNVSEEEEQEPKKKEKSIPALKSMIIHVGPSSTNAKNVKLPFMDMKVGHMPQNHLQPRWKDSFHTEVFGSTLVVTRTDSKSGWDMDLKLGASYSEDNQIPESIGLCYSNDDMRKQKKEDIDNPFKFNATIQTSIIVLDLHPDQMLRARYGSFVYLQHGDGEIKVESVPLPTKTRILKQIISDAKEKQLINYSFHGPPRSVGKVALGVNSRNKILLFPLSECGKKLFCKRGTFLASSTDIIVENDQPCYGIQAMYGSGDLILRAPSPIVKKLLKAGEKMIIQVQCIVAFTRYVDFEHHTVNQTGVGGLLQKMVHIINIIDEMIPDDDKKNVKNVGKKKSMPAIAQLTGPGTVWVNTQNFG